MNETPSTDDKKAAKAPEPVAKAAEPVRNLDIKAPQVRNLDQPKKSPGVKVFTRDGTVRAGKK
ncbi:hypothetical protein UFOVP736_9 [uncultured Caudovirales phage]|uniref:Uncharacterized protein n=1 Tax=uncultured Caudovirales phage TaxID=2100421 RepID=A0A6J7X0X6_9CAUD|nr:hypothetical protein UFOVP705_72 [uncultured Caudovirales phage]CAB5223777.1 hypothetical protein UFOVP736_9 [uncultured Caudovirales phage]